MGISHEYHSTHGRRRRRRRVGVVAVDPTSPLTGGSVLGDRLRMMTHTPDPRLFFYGVKVRAAP